MRKKIFKSELKSLFILIVFFWIIAFSLLAMYSCMLVNSLKSENIESSAMYRLKDVDSMLFKNMSDIEVFMELINSDKQKFTQFINTQDINGISAEATKLIKDNPYIRGFAIVAPDNKYITYNMPNITSDSIIHLQVVFPLTSEKIGDSKWFFSDDNTNTIFNEYIIFGANVFETDTSKLYIFLNKSILSGVLQADAESTITLLDENGKLFASSDSEAFNKMLYSISDDVINIYNTANGFISFEFNSDRYVCIHHQSEYTGFRYIEFKKTNTLYGDSQRIIMIIVVLSIIFIMITVLMYKIMKKRLINPLTQLSGKMESFNHKSLDKKIHITGSSEINIIVNSFNTLIQKVNNIIEDVKIHEEQKKAIELNALKSQIRPHFLYNTLNSIRIISLNNQQYDIAKSIQILSKLLRNTVSSYETFTELKKEIESVKNYIELMQICYDNKINITYDIQPQVEQCPVPSIILQPIIENAIGHGLSAKLCQSNQPATIFISAKEKDNKLCINITDNGIGMTKEQIFSCLYAPVDKSGKNIGLKNLVNRIKLLYEDKGNVLIKSEPDKFTTVIITIPIQ